MTTRIFISKTLRERLAEFIEMYAADELKDPVALALALHCLSKLALAEANDLSEERSQANSQI